MKKFPLFRFYFLLPALLRAQY